MVFVKVKSLALYLEKEELKEFIDLATSHTQKSRLDEGCLAFEMRYAYLPDGVKVTFLELWEDAKALEAHGENAKNRPEINRINELRIYKEMRVTEL